ncbi:MAG: phosphatase PAP2 family protein, partial [Pyrinomonadaceae bacterium]
SSCLAQTAPAKVPSQPSSQSGPTAIPNPEKNFFANILRDQREIWTSPFHLNRGDAKWAFPLTLSAAALFATDRHTSGELVEGGDNLRRLRISKKISRLGSLYTTGGIAAGFYLVGRTRNDARARETGVLAGEALINSTIVVQALKAVSQRQRPSVDNSSGEFFEGGRSFPSGHAVNAWSVATVIAQEYGQQRPLVRVGAYGLATAVSLSRYTGRNHFLSDVLVGSAIGYGIGRYVYGKHHNPALDALNEKHNSKDLMSSKLFPQVAPLYHPRARVYGAMLTWSF